MAEPAARNLTGAQLRIVQLRALVVAPAAFAVMSLVPGLFGPGRAWWLLATVPIYVGGGLLALLRRAQVGRSAGLAIFACGHTALCGVLADPPLLRAMFMVAVIMSAFNAATGAAPVRVVRAVAGLAAAGTMAIALTGPGSLLGRCLAALAFSVLVGQPALTVLRYTQRLEWTRAEAERLASTDPLTGLLNRRGLVERIPELLRRASSTGARVAVLVIDLDHFKRINDTLGHVAGDAVLCRVADAVCDLLRAGDVVARIGGEELCVLAVLEGPDGADRLAERIRIAVERDAAVRGTTVSAGGIEIGSEHIVTGAQDPIEAVWTLLDQADGLLYEAKHAGRNTVRVRAA